MKPKQSKEYFSIFFIGLCLLGSTACTCTCTKKEKAGEKLVFVKGGSFIMGDVFKDGRKAMLPETPLHEVVLNDFFIAPFEATVEEFRTFVRDADYKTLKEQKLEEQYKKDEIPYDMHTWEKCSFSQADDHPVVWMAWEDAAAYCNWLSMRDGVPPAYDLKTYQVLDAEGRPTDDISKVRGYRLPTEAEWEYAAREGGKKVLYGNGKNTARKGEIVCLFLDPSLSKEERDNVPSSTRPVGSCIPNALGLYDMSGNAWEWCLDQGYEYKEERQVNPYFAGRDHMIRGGSHASEAFSCSVFCRINFWFQSQCEASGFRIARSAP